jgi:predicted MFS family arabinose efflux permease
MDTGPDVQYKPMLDSWDTFKLLFNNKTALLLFVQGIPGCLPWGLVAVFMSDYLSDDCGMSVESATIVVSMFGIGAFFGLLFGGGYGQYLYNRNKKHLVIFFAGAQARVDRGPEIYLQLTTTSRPPPLPCRQVSG